MILKNRLNKKRDKMMYKKPTNKLFLTVLILGVLTVFNGTSYAQLGKVARKVKDEKSDKKTDDSKSSNDSKSSKSKVVNVEASANNPAAEKAFNDNKENLKSCYDFLSQFNNTNDEKDVMDMANSVSNVMKLAESTISDLKKNIADISEFEKSNSEAKEMHLKSKIGWLETAIEKAKDKFGGIKSSLLRSIVSDVEWLAMPEATAQFASSTMDQITQKFALLDKLYPGDSDVDASRKTNLPKAKANYDKLMKQLAQNRMPASKYSGDNKAELEKKISAAYTKRYPGEVVKRVVIIDSGWKEKTELKDDNTKAYWQTSDYIGVHIAILKNKSCNVFIMTFRKDKKTGEIEAHSVGTSYTVLVENINK